MTQKKCFVMGCKNSTIQRYQDEDVDVYFCKKHKPLEIHKQIKGGEIIITNH